MLTFFFFLRGVSSSNYEYNNETKALVQAFSSTTNKGGEGARVVVVVWHTDLFSPFYFSPLNWTRVFHVF